MLNVTLLRLLPLLLVDDRLLPLLAVDAELAELRLPVDQLLALAVVSLLALAVEADVNVEADVPVDRLLGLTLLADVEVL